MPPPQEATFELSEDSDGESDSSVSELRQQILRIREVRRLNTGRILPHGPYGTPQLKKEQLAQAAQV